SAVQTKRHVRLPIFIRPFKWSDASPLSTRFLPACLCRTLLRGRRCALLCIAQKTTI
ncbi:hypothetical protein BDR05DRAFT_966092, partial [Suillus weaverae]